MNKLTKEKEKNELEQGEIGWELNPKKLEIKKKKSKRNKR